MNKNYNYKIGDKVILPDINDLGEIFKWKANIPYKITSIGEYCVTSLFNIRCCLAFTRFKYYYEKPLYNLFDKITTHCPIIEKDHDTIKPFIDSDRTLTNEELIICQKLWEKYNNINK